MTRPVIGLLIAASCFVATGCVAPSPSPTPTSGLLAFVPGPAPAVYMGTAVDSIGGTGPLTISLASSNGLTSGSWHASFGGQTTDGTLDGFDWQRVITGTVSGSTYTAKVDQCLETDTQGCSPDCSFSFTGTITSTGLTGIYTANPIQSCPARSGNVTLTKQ